MVVPCGHPRIVVRNDMDLPHGRMQIFHAGVRIFCADGHGSSMRIRVENDGNQKADFVCNNAEGSRNTSRGLFKFIIRIELIWT